jgi:CBS domain-containing protein
MEQEGAMTPVQQAVTALIATFWDQHDADRFVVELKRAGFKDDEIGIIAPQKGQADSVEEGAKAGAITGGTLGACAGAIATGLIPGIGPVLAGGLLAGVLGGAAAGATAGSLLGVLLGLGVPEDQARKYEEEFFAGRTPVVVQASGRGTDALAVLNRLNNEERHRRARSSGSQVKDVMTVFVQTVGPHTPLREAAELMKTLDVGTLPVCDNDRLVGMITDRDITVRATAEAIPPGLGQVRDVMTPNVVFCFEDEPVQQAAQLMKEHQIRRLVVLNNEKRLVGIVSLGDLAVETGNEQLAGETLERVSESA